MLQDRLGVSERRACKVVGQHRSTQRLEPPAPPDDEAELREFLRRFAKRRPRWGWRRAAKELRRSGWSVNNKRVRRLWRDEGLQVPTKTKKKRLTGVGTHVGAMSCWTTHRGPLTPSSASPITRPCTTSWTTRSTLWPARRWST